MSIKILLMAVFILLFSSFVSAKNGDCAEKPKIQIMGIEWGDSIEVVIKKLSNYGFKRQQVSDNAYFFEGNMFDCQADILVVPIKNKVHNIEIMMGRGGDALELFHEMVEKLNKKYGKPSKEAREYEHPYAVSVGDIYKGISEEKIFFANFYTDKNGSLIILSIADKNEILLSYKSKIGILEEKRIQEIDQSKQKKLEDIL